MGLAIEVIVTGAAVGSYYALVAIGVQITYAGTRVVNFAQGNFVAGGALAIWSLSVEGHVNIWLAFVMVCVAGYIAGVLFELVVVRAVSNRPLIQSALATVAASLAIEGIFELIYGPATLSVPAFVSSAPAQFGSAVVPLQNFLVLGIMVIFASAVFAFLRYTRPGLAIRATAESREGASIVGVKMSRVASTVFGLSAVTSVAAGALMAPITGVTFQSGDSVLLIAFTAAVLGGLKSTVAAAAGGVALGFALTIVQATPLSGFPQTTVMAILIAFLIFRPQGIAGTIDA